MLLYKKILHRPSEEFLCPWPVQPEPDDGLTS